MAPAPIPARQSLRLWFASFVYVLICALRRLGLAHTRPAEPTCGTIELKLLKIGARVRVSVRRIKVAMLRRVPMPTNSPWHTPEYGPRPDGAAGPEPFPPTKKVHCTSSNRRTHAAIAHRLRDRGTIPAPGQAKTPPNARCGEKTG
ncbi:MAG: hypothetical protein EOS46_30915 [Mesorhizobium sp.]|nr:hypothetical protein EOD15_32715 [Mesorhizobium sp. M7A.T.Ca.US.000.02.2.1]RUT83421.1 hypothetical protein EOD14_24210 [Mesorhizobium sp. M7A.T.Ca.US.000.02.1.1]RUU05307.1 hypothetical protein EOD12_03955 [Mesorhizobium sp. M7A.T.Ca.TU.009.02.1.1]RUU56133.1 hypothetical protein EOC99_27035 [Mesorhizobium sp. M7A.T.Ca.TU.009.01.1.1]RUU88464.1 hypothetical protein EOD03_04715 [Mesorhizobium sp. M7A.T.Ca.TU.009.01.1.2]RUW69213.1 hypothetical protein EOA31_23755 [Mesorhizobium sp. M4B.F.Ca.ET.0